MTVKTFSSRLRELREKAGLSVQELATKANLNRQVIYKLEDGNRDPAWRTVQALADALKVKTEAFRSEK